MIEPGLLGNVDLFAGVNASARKVLCERGTVRRFEPDAVLWRRGGRPQGLFVVLEGEVRVVRVSDGRQRVLHTEGPGGTLGEIPLFEGSPSPATALAARRCACLVFDRETILDAIDVDPRFAFVLLARLASRLRQVIDRLERYSAQPVPARLAAYLLDRCGDEADTVFTLGRSQREVAEELGTARELIVRGLRALREAGTIESAGRNRFRVRDLEALYRSAAAVRGQAR